MKIKISTLGIILCHFIVNSQSIARLDDIRLGASIELFSHVLEENRTINIYLPESYDNSTGNKYPVIYILDGGINDIYIPTVGLIRFLSSKKGQQISESIVVGIENVDRRRDFTKPSKIESDLINFPSSGESEKFLSFLSLELMPLIEKEYRTDNIKTIIGHSLGGLLASEILLTKSELFDNYLIINPSLWWNDNKILFYNTANISFNKKIYVGVWERENDKKITDQFVKKIKKQALASPDKKIRVQYDIIAQNEHSNVVYPALYNGLRKLK
ncbi:alpha/beta hydrolase [Arenibacter algicola]|uniref:alpha/beta hydrolase n=1 Tax=Arenibacter algicola TaxID=616991 RepID=UPI001C073B66|nr:alpha/beta hydrolase [Arenibacter algicola]